MNIFKKKIIVDKEEYECLQIKVMYLENVKERLEAELEEADKIRDCNVAAYSKELNKLMVRNNKLVSRNSQLPVDLMNKDCYIQGLEQEIDLHENTIKELEEIIAKQDKYVFCGNESKRQLRKLAKEIENNPKIDKRYICTYLNELSMYIGGECSDRFDITKKGE